MIDPKAISQDLLDRSGAAYLSGKADAFVQCFALPHVIRTFETVQVIETRADLLAIFDAMRAYFRKVGLTDMVRHCLSAHLVGETTIRATHESRYLSGTCLVQRPIVAMSTLRRIDDVWYVTEGQYAIQDAADHVTALTRRHASE